MESFSKSDEECSGTSFLREKHRELRKETCRLERDAILRNKRIRLNEEELGFKKISIKEAEKITISLKNGKKDITTLKAIKRFAAESQEHIEAFLRINGALYSLVGILTGVNSEKQLEAAGCLTNLATGSHKSISKVLKASGAYMITYLYGCSPFLQDQCAWALGNMLADSPQCCDTLKLQGLLPALVGLLQSPYPTVIQSAVFALRNYTAWEEENSVKLMDQGVVARLLSLFSQEDLKLSVKADVAHILFHMSIRIQNWNAYLRKEDLERLLNLLVCFCNDLEANVIVITPLVRFFGNLTSGDDLEDLEILFTPSFGFCAKQLLSSKYHHLKKEMLWLLSNVLVNRNTSILSALDIPFILGTLPPLLSVLDSAVIPVLYFLCVLVSQHGSSHQYVADSGLMCSIAVLQQCGKHDVAQAANVFTSLVTCQPENILT